jgi:hypothetical protein
MMLLRTAVRFAAAGLAGVPATAAEDDDGTKRSDIFFNGMCVTDYLPDAAATMARFARVPRHDDDFQQAAYEYGQGLAPLQGPVLFLGPLPDLPAGRGWGVETPSIELTRKRADAVADALAVIQERTGAGNSVAWRTGLGAPGNAGVAAAVKNIKGGIGYVEFAYAAENGMQALQLANGSGKFVTPTVPGFLQAAEQADWDNAKNMAATMLNMPGNNSWPIVSATYILVPRNPKDPARTQSVLKYVDWSFRNGAATADRLHYIMLPAAVQDRVRAQWATLAPAGKPLWPAN